MSTNLDFDVESALNDMRKMEYPVQVDVVDAVMEQVSKQPILVPARKHRIWVIAAACIAALLLVNVSLYLFRGYNEESVGTVLADVYDYNTNYGLDDQAAYQQMDVAMCLFDD
ncbi:MAG: hypothetical protein KBT45_07630 [Bacteroidales bacterium]|nr:hypothetical protein [Candidatus Colimorpha pelethequi]